MLRILRRLSVSFLGMSVSGIFACGGEPSLPTDDMAPEGPASQNTPNSPSTTKKDPSPTGGGAGTGMTPAGEEEPFNPSPFPIHEPHFDPNYPGLDDGLIPDVLVPGCTDSFDPETGGIHLQLSAESYGVELHADGISLFANGEECTKADGSKLGLEELVRVEVAGGREANVVLLDLSKGSFGESLYQNEAGFHIELADGYDLFMLRGTPENDNFFVGEGSHRILGALTDFARINLWVRDSEELVVSSGAGDDRLQPVTLLNVGLYDINSGAKLQVGDLTIPVSAFGHLGNDELRGGSVDDRLVGGDGDDVLSGGEGNDFFDEETHANGADTINGGPGIDTLSYMGRSENVFVELCLAATDRGCEADCACEALNGEDAEGDRVVNIETLRTGRGDDTLIGSPLDDYLYGEAGNDTLDGRDGSDVLQGGHGLDTFQGGDNADICDDDPGEIVEGCEI